jgi:hypothetical protein
MVSYLFDACECERKCRSWTYAAVAAKISTRRALVAIAKLRENRNVNRHRRESRTGMFVTIYNAMIELIGVKEEATVPVIYTTC